MTLGSRIAALRAAKGISQAELAERLEVSRQSVSKWETDGSVPELDKLVRLSELFDVSLDSLVKDTQAQPEDPEQTAPAPESPSAPQRESSRVIIGSAVLLMGAVLALIFSLRGERLLASLMVTFPFIGCGVICMLLRERPWLWCGWYLWFGFDLFGIRPMLNILPLYYYTSPLVFLLALAVLLPATGWAFRDRLPQTAKGRRRLILVCLILALVWVVTYEVGLHYYRTFNFFLPRWQADLHRALGELLYKLSRIPLFTLFSIALAALFHALGRLRAKRSQPE